MSETVLSKPGSIGLSIAGEKDNFKVIANILMMGQRLLKLDVTEDIIIDYLEEWDESPTPENIAKVRAFFKS